ncbi:type I polyketide synthase [Teredinibacter turnerae]|uniref:type I polyketide synthase n=1 Tax=Teredinibacter turnerae TaxID=2426 RepID=UPI0003AAFDE8|nr:type I polyketide synthase [Teredinibacter turnerae]
MNEVNVSDTDIAIIGMAGRFPGSDSIEEFWQNLMQGKSGISDVSEKELRDIGIPQSVYGQPNYVKRTASISDAKCFDAEFFGFSHAEARLLDPQQRLFLEYAWKALEAAGYIPDEIDSPVGVYAGCGLNRYLLTNMDIDTVNFDIDEFQKMIASDKDFLATRVAYKLNLRGPAINVQSACSTSLLAAQMGIAGLQSYQCDVALCGGATVAVPHGAGYLHSDGLIFSKDGYCRPFSPGANGTLFGEGVGAVVLKRLEDALNDGDDVVAIISAAAVNNDGRDKVGFTAPSANGQTEVISLAHELAEVAPEQIRFVETHGTATALGDPIELTGLARAFGDLRVAEPFCALGTLKANIGHLDAAAGVAALIKTALVLQHRTVPPVCVNGAAPQVGQEQSPFYFNRTPVDLSNSTETLYAGVSSFGVGGTNVHLIMRDAAEYQPAVELPTGEKYALPISAHHRDSLKALRKEIARYTRQYPASLADVSCVLRESRKRLQHGQAVVAYPKADGEPMLVNGEQLNLNCNQRAAFMFTGQGAHFLGMTSELYAAQPCYAKELDAVLAVLQELGLGEVVSYLQAPEKLSPADENRTDLVQPALVAVQYALARCLMRWGIQPAVLMGHSIGEYTAACLDGIFDIRTALRIVAERGRLMAATEEGAMVVAFATRSAVEALLDDTLEISIENSRENIVVSGSHENINAFIKRLDGESIKHATLPNRHPFHSRYMEPALAPFAAAMGEAKFAPAAGLFQPASKEAKAGQAATVEYWTAHLRHEVNFKFAIEQAAKAGIENFIEIGPGGALTRFVKDTLDANVNVFRTLGNAKTGNPENVNFDLAVAGMALQFPRLDIAAWGFGVDGRRRAIPTYPFRKEEHWLSPKRVAQSSQAQQTPVARTQLNPSNDDEGGARQDLDRSLLAVWAQVLEQPQLTIDTNFFDLGGDSLSAIKLVKDMHKATGIEFTHSSVFEHPTIRDLVDQMGDDAEKAASVVLLNGVAEGVPVFCLCGVQIYKEFANHFLHNPVYGMYAKEEIAIIQDEAEGEGSAEVSIDSLVDTYVQAVIRHLSGKELMLVGLSFGGLLALEVNQKLTELGYRVKRVVLFDSYLQSSHYRTLPKLMVDSFARYQQYGLRRFSSIIAGRVSQKVAGKLGLKSGAKRVVWDHESAERNRGDAFHRIARAFNATGKTYDFDALLIKASRTNAGFGMASKPDYGMSKVITGHLDVAEVHADHVDMVTGDVVDEVYDLVHNYIKAVN